MFRTAAGLSSSCNLGIDQASFPIAQHSRFNSHDPDHGRRAHLWAGPRTPLGLEREISQEGAQGALSSPTAPPADPIFHPRQLAGLRPRLGGYTVLRTVYTPESDALFPAAMERLCKYVSFWCHEGRFPSYGERAEQKQITFVEPNDELVRRFHLDVVEDLERLAGLDGDADGLTDYFRWWVAGVDAGGAGAHERGWDPRFCTYLVVDAESLASLAGIPVEPPPLRCARDVEEKWRFLAAGEGAWVWLVDALPRTGEEDGEDHGRDGHRGWLRVELSDIEVAWFDRLVRCICADQALLFGREEPTGSGIFYYSEQDVAPSYTQGMDLN